MNGEYQINRELRNHLTINELTEFHSKNITQERRTILWRLARARQSELQNKHKLLQ